MNKTYRIVFNKVRGSLMVVSEATSSVQNKGSGEGVRFGEGLKKAAAVGAAALALGMASPAWADATDKTTSATDFTGESTTLEGDYFYVLNTGASGIVYSGDVTVKGSAALHDKTTYIDPNNSKYVSDKLSEANTGGSLLTVKNFTLGANSTRSGIYFDQYGILTVKGDYLQEFAEADFHNGRLCVTGKAEIKPGAVMKLGGVNSGNNYGAGTGHLIVQGTGGLILGAEGASSGPTITITPKSATLTSGIHASSLTMHAGNITVGGEGGYVNVGDVWNSTSNTWEFAGEGGHNFVFKGGTVSLASKATMTVDGAINMESAAELSLAGGSRVTAASLQGTTESNTTSSIKVTSGTAYLQVANALTLSNVNVTASAKDAGLSVVKNSSNDLQDATLSGTEIVGTLNVKNADVTGAVTVLSNATVSSSLSASEKVTIKGNGALYLYGETNSTDAMTTSVSANAFASEAGSAVTAGDGTTKTTATISANNGSGTIDLAGATLTVQEKASLTLKSLSSTLGKGSLKGNLFGTSLVLTDVVSLDKAGILMYATNDLKSSEDRPGTVKTTFTAGTATLRLGKSQNLSTVKLDVGTGSSLALQYGSSDMAVSLGDADVKGTLTAGSVTLAANRTLKLAGGTIDVTGTFSDGQTTKETGTFAANGGTIWATDGKAAVIQTRTDIETFDLTKAGVQVDSDASLTLGYLATTEGSTLQARSLTLKNAIVAGTLNMLNGSIAEGGQLTLQDGGKVAASGTLTATGSDDKAVVIRAADGGTATIEATSLELSKTKVDAGTGLLQVTAASTVFKDAVELQGAMTAQAVSFTRGGTLTLKDGASLVAASFGVTGESTNKATVAVESGSAYLSNSTAGAAIDLSNLSIQAGNGTLYAAAKPAEGASATLLAATLDDAEIASGTLTAKEAVVGSGKTLTIQNEANLKVNALSAAGATVTVNAGGNLVNATEGATDVSTAGTLTNSGTVTLGGSLTATTFTNSGTATVAGGLTANKLTNNAGATLNLGSGTLTVKQSATLNGTVKGGALALDNSASVTTTGATFTGALSGGSTTKITNTGTLTANLSNFKGTYEATSASATVTGVNNTAFNGATISLSGGAKLENAVLGTENKVLLGAGSTLHTANRTEGGTLFTTNNTYEMSSGILYATFADFFNNVTSASVSGTIVNADGSNGSETTVSGLTPSVGNLKTDIHSHLTLKGGVIDFNDDYTTAVVTKVLSEINNSSTGIVSSTTATDKHVAVGSLSASETSAFVNFSGTLNTSGLFFNVSYLNSLGTTASNVAFTTAKLTNSVTTDAGDEEKTNTSLVIGSTEATASNANVLKGAGLTGFEAISNVASVTVQDGRTLLLAGFAESETDKRVLQSTTAGQSGAATVGAGSTLVLGFADDQTTYGVIGEVTLEGTSGSTAGGALKVTGHDKFTADGVTLNVGASLVVDAQKAEGDANMEKSRLEVTAYHDADGATVNVGPLGELVITSVKADESGSSTKTISASLSNEGVLTINDTDGVTVAKSYVNKGTTNLKKDSSVTFQSDFTNNASQSVTAEGASITVKNTADNKGTIGEATAGLKSFSAGTLENTGVIYLTEGGSITVQNTAGSFSNTGDKTSTGVIQDVTTLTTTGSAANAGLIAFKKATNQSATLTAQAGFTNTGTVTGLETASVTSDLTNGDDKETQASLQFTGDSSTLLVTGTLLNQKGATITGLTAINPTPSGGASSGNVTNAGTIGEAGNSKLTTVNAGGTLENTGVIYLAAGESLATSVSAGSFSNTGDQKTSGVVQNVTTLTTTGSATNAGLIAFKKATNQSATLAAQAGFTNTGTVTGLETATVTGDLTNGDAKETQASLQFTGDSSTLSVTGTLLNQKGATITGLTAINPTPSGGASSGNVTNAGTIGEAGNSKLTTVNAGGTLENTGVIYLAAGESLATSVSAGSFSNTGDKTTTGVIQNVTTLTTEGVATNSGLVAFHSASGTAATLDAKAGFTNTGRVTGLVTGSVTGDLTNRGSESSTASIGFTSTTATASSLAVTGQLDNATQATITGLKTLTTGTADATDSKASKNAGELVFTGEGSTLTANNGFNNTDTGAIEKLASAQVSGTLTNAGTIGKSASETELSSLEATKLENTGAIYLKNGVVSVKDLENKGTGTAAGLSGVTKLTTTGTATNESTVAFADTETQTAQLNVNLGTFTNQSGGSITGLDAAVVKGTLVNGATSDTATSVIDFSGSGTTKTLETAEGGVLENTAKGLIKNLTTLTIAGTGTSKNAGQIGENTKALETLSVGKTENSQKTAGKFENTGTVYVTNASVTAESTFTNDGTVKAQSVTNAGTWTGSGSVTTTSLNNTGTFTAGSVTFAESGSALTNSGTFTLTSAGESVSVASLTNKKAGEGTGTAVIDVGQNTTSLTVTSSLDNQANATIKAKNFTVSGSGTNAGAIQASGNVTVAGANFASTGSITTGGNFIVNSGITTSVAGSLTGKGSNSALSLGEKATLTIGDNTTVSGFANLAAANGSTLVNNAEIKLSSVSDAQLSASGFTYEAGSAGALLDSSGQAVKLSDATIRISTDGQTVNNVANIGKNSTVKIVENGTLVLRDKDSTNTTLNAATGAITVDALTKGDAAGAHVTIAGGTLKTDIFTVFGDVSNKLAAKDFAGQTIAADSIFNAGTTGVPGSQTVGTVKEAVKNLVTFTSGAIAFAEDYTTSLLNSVITQLNAAFGSDATGEISQKTDGSTPSRWASFTGTLQDAGSDGALTVAVANAVKDGEAGAIFASTSLKGNADATTLTFGAASESETNANRVTTTKLGVQTLLGTDTAVVQDGHTLLLVGKTAEGQLQKLLENATNNGTVTVNAGSALVLGDFDTATKTGGVLGTVTVKDGSLTAQGGDEFTIGELTLTDTENKTSSLTVTGQGTKLTATTLTDNASVSTTVDNGASLVIGTASALAGSYRTAAGGKLNVQASGASALAVKQAFTNEGTLTGGSNGTKISAVFEAGLVNGSDASGSGVVTGVETLTLLGAGDAKSVNRGSIGTSTDHVTTLVIGSAATAGELENQTGGQVFADKVTLAEKGQLTNAGVVTTAAVTGNAGSALVNTATITGLNEVSTSGSLTNSGTVEFNGTGTVTKAMSVAGGFENQMNGAVIGLATLGLTGGASTNAGTIGSESQLVSLTVGTTGDSGSATLENQSGGTIHASTVAVANGTLTNQAGGVITGLDTVTVKGSLVNGATEGADATIDFSGTGATKSLETVDGGALVNNKTGVIEHLASLTITGTGASSNAGRIGSATDRVTTLSIGKTADGSTTSGTFTNTGDLYAATASVTAGSQLTNRGKIDATTLTNNGTVENSGTVTATSVTNAGLWSGEGAVNAATIENSGDFSAKTTRDTFTKLENSGSFTLTAQAEKVTAADIDNSKGSGSGVGDKVGTMDFGAGTDLAVTGTLKNETGATIIAKNVTLSGNSGSNAGTLDAHGSVTVSGNSFTSSGAIKATGDVTVQGTGFASTGTITTGGDFAVASDASAAVGGTLTGKGEQSQIELADKASLTINAGATVSGFESLVIGNGVTLSNAGTVTLKTSTIDAAGKHFTYNGAGGTLKDEKGADVKISGATIQISTDGQTVNNLANAGANSVLDVVKNGVLVLTDEVKDDALKTAAGKLTTTALLTGDMKGSTIVLNEGTLKTNIHTLFGDVTTKDVTATDFEGTDITDAVFVTGTTGLPGIQTVGAVNADLAKLITFNSGAIAFTDSVSSDLVSSVLESLNKTYHLANDPITEGKSSNRWVEFASDSAVTSSNLTLDNVKDIRSDVTGVIFSEKKLDGKGTTETLTFGDNGDVITTQFGVAGLAKTETVNVTDGHTLLLTGSSDRTAKVLTDSTSGGTVNVTNATLVLGDFDTDTVKGGTIGSVKVTTGSLTAQGGDQFAVTELELKGSDGKSSTLLVTGQGTQLTVGTITDDAKTTVDVATGATLVLESAATLNGDYATETNGTLHVQGATGGADKKTVVFAQAFDNQGYLVGDAVVSSTEVNASFAAGFTNGGSGEISGFTKVTTAGGESTNAGKLTTTEAAVASGKLTNTSTGTVTASRLTGEAGTTVENAGTVTGLDTVNTSGAYQNSGTTEFTGTSTGTTGKTMTVAGGLTNSGTVTGLDDLNLTGATTSQNTGTIDFKTSTDGTLSISGGTLENSGTVAGAKKVELGDNATLHNKTDGVVETSDITGTNGAKAPESASVVNEGTIKGLTTVSTAGSFENQQSVVFKDKGDGKLDVGTLTNTGDITGVKDLDVAGNVTNNGSLAGLGTADIKGSLTTGEGSTLIFTGTAGTLSVTGSVTNQGSIGTDSGNRPASITVGTGDGATSNFTNGATGSVIAGSITVNGSGTLKNDAGGSIDAATITTGAGGLTNEGSLTGLNQVSTSGEFKNAGTATFTGTDRSLSATTLTNEGTVTGLASATVAAGSNSGVIDMSGAESAFTVTGSFTNDASGAMTNVGTVVVDGSKSAATFTNNGTLTGAGGSGVNVTVTSGSGDSATKGGFVTTGDVTLGTLTGNGTFTNAGGRVTFAEGGSGSGFTGDFKQTGAFASSDFTGTRGLGPGSSIEVTAGTLTMTNLAPSSVTVTGGTLAVKGSVDSSLTLGGAGTLETSLAGVKTTTGYLEKVTFTKTTDGGTGNLHLTDESIAMSDAEALAKAMSAKGGTESTIIVTKVTGSTSFDYANAETVFIKKANIAVAGTTVHLQADLSQCAGLVGSMKGQVSEEGIDQNTLVLTTNKITALDDSFDDSTSDKVTDSKTLYQQFSNMTVKSLDLAETSNKVFVTGEKSLTLAGNGSSLVSGAKDGKDVVLFVGSTTSLNGNAKEGRLALGTETKSAGGEIAGTVKVRENSLVDVAGSGAFKVTAIESNKGVISVGVGSTAGGSLAVEKLTTTEGSITVGADSSASLAVDSLKTSSTEIRVGTTQASGALTVGTLAMDAGTSLFLDPVWGNESSTASIASLASDNTVTGRIVVGRNSKLVIGSDSITVLDKALAGAGASVAENSVQAALYVAKTTKVSGALYVDGRTYTGEDEAHSPSATDSGVKVGAGSALVVKKGAWLEGASGSSLTFTAGEGSLIYVDDLSASDQSAVIAKNFTYSDGVSEASYAATTDGLKVVFASTDGNVLTVKVSEDDTTTVDSLTVAGNTYHGFLKGVIGSDSLAGQRLKAIFDRTQAGYSREKAARELNRIAFMNAAGAASNTLVTSALATTDSIEAHAAAIETGKLAADSHLWATAEGANTRVSSYEAGSATYGYKSEIAGVTMGWDAALADSTFGAAFTAGKGTVRGTGVSSGTKNSVEYWGLSLYGKCALPWADLVGSVSYLQSTNDTWLEGYSAKPKATAVTAGVRLEKTIPASQTVSVTPHAGLRATTVATDGFTAGGFTYDADRANIVTVPVGATVQGNFTTASGAVVKPMLDLSVTPAFGDTKTKQTFKAAGSAVEDTFDARVASAVTWGVGLGVKVEKSAHALDFGYGVKAGTSGRVDQSLKAKYTFRF